MDIFQARQIYQHLFEEGTRLAGGLRDLPQRAMTYHHLFRHSRYSHAFPAMAAHGALWARGYFKVGMFLGRVLSLQYFMNAKKRAEQMCALAQFADAFREINRRVCVDTYANYHFTAQWGRHPLAVEIVSPDLLDALNSLHAARRAGRQLSLDERRYVFQSHFLNEQRYVVSPAIAKAVDDLHWPALKFIALKPWIRFSYFPVRRFLWFRDFSNQEERIANGLQAFDWAAKVGWQAVEQTLNHYALLPREFFAEPVTFFAELRNTILSQ